MIKCLAQGHPRSMRQSQKHSLAALNLKRLSFFKSQPLTNLGRGSVKSHPTFLQQSVLIQVRAELQGHSICSQAGFCMFSWPIWLRDAISEPSQGFELFEIHPLLILTAHTFRQREATALLVQLEGKGTSPYTFIQSYLAPFLSLLQNA